MRLRFVTARPALSQPFGRSGRSALLSLAFLGAGVAGGTCRLQAQEAFAPVTRLTDPAALPTPSEMPSEFPQAAADKDRTARRSELDALVRERAQLDRRIRDMQRQMENDPTIRGDRKRAGDVFSALPTDRAGTAQEKRAQEEALRQAQNATRSALRQAQEAMEKAQRELKKAYEAAPEGKGMGAFPAFPAFPQMNFKWDDARMNPGQWKAIQEKFREDWKKQQPQWEQQMREWREQFKQFKPWQPQDKAWQRREEATKTQPPA